MWPLFVMDHTMAPMDIVPSSCWRQVSHISHTGCSNIVNIIICWDLCRELIYTQILFNPFLFLSHFVAEWKNKYFCCQIIYKMPETHNNKFFGNCVFLKWHVRTSWLLWMILTICLQVLQLSIILFSIIVKLLCLQCQVGWLMLKYDPSHATWCTLLTITHATNIINTQNMF